MCRRCRWTGSLYLFALLLPVMLGLGPVPARAAERIRAFDVRIELLGDDSFEVAETIRYDFGSQQRHGIIRDIPIKYGRGRAADYRIEIDKIQVRGANDHSWPVKTRRRGRNLSLRIGDPERYVTGVQEYRIRYRVRRGLLWFEEHDEIYWNATGDEWKVPIDAARVEVLMPVGATTELTDQMCFTGRRGSIEQACSSRAEGDRVVFAADRPLFAGEGLSVAVALPKGVLAEPSAWDKWRDRASDYLGPWILLPFLVLGSMIYLWRRFGRDPEPSPAIAVQYEPPRELRPAEVGMVVDESADAWDITAAILDLAIRGYLRIHRLEGKKFFVLSTTDHELERITVETARRDELKEHERKLLDALFKEGDRVRISELRNKFYKELPAVLDALRSDVTWKGAYFSSHPRGVRLGWALVGAAIVGIAIMSGTAGGAGLKAIVPIGISGAIILGFSRYMPRKTRKGRKAYEHILGFRDFVARVDRDRLERMGGRTVDQFESVLPYAIVLRVADPWAEAFDDIYKEAPQWYVGSYHGGFHPRYFVSDLGDGLRTMSTAMTAKPKSSGSGSSGFGGGGFSGGGFGGGGGSSW